MTKAGFWTSAWVAIVCVAGGARLISASSRSGGLESDTGEVAKARRLGVPIDPAAATNLPIPRGQNAADIYATIAQTMEGEGKVQDKLSLTLARSPLDPVTPQNLKDDNMKRHQADSALPHLQPIFQLADTLYSRPKCDLSVLPNGPDAGTVAPSTAAHTLTLDLCLKADFLDRQGDWAGALKSLKLAHRVSVDSGTRAGLIGILIQIGETSMVREQYEVLVQRHSHDLTFLSAADAQLSGETFEPDLHKMLVGDFVNARKELLMIHSLKELREAFGVRATDDDIFTSNFITGEKLQSELDTRLLSVWIDLYPQLPKEPTDWKAYRRVLKRENELSQSNMSTLNSLNQYQLSMAVSCVERIGEAETYDRLMVDSIRLLKARAEDGKLPVLLSKKLDPDGSDPFDGNPLRYQRLGSGFLLYSVGPDGVDNGGHKRSSSDPEGAGYDLVEAFG